MIQILQDCLRAQLLPVTLNFQGRVLPVILQANPALLPVSRFKQNLQSTCRSIGLTLFSCFFGVLGCWSRTWISLLILEGHSLLEVTIAVSRAWNTARRSEQILCLGTHAASVIPSTWKSKQSVPGRALLYWVILVLTYRSHCSAVLLISQMWSHVKSSSASIHTLNFRIMKLNV